MLGNKNDLPNALDTDNLRDRLNLETIHDRDVACYSISCKNKTNIDKVLKVILNPVRAKILMEHNKWKSSLSFKL